MGSDDDIKCKKKLEDEIVIKNSIFDFLWKIWRATMPVIKLANIGKEMIRFLCLKELAKLEFSLLTEIELPKKGLWIYLINLSGKANFLVLCTDIRGEYDCRRFFDLT